MEMNPIPLIDLRGEAAPFVALAQREETRCRALLQAGRKQLTPPMLNFMDRRSKAWAARNDTPYRAEISAIDQGMPTGLWFMNFCYEWGCTTQVSATAEGHAELCRSLDWPFNGIGCNVVVAHVDRPGDAGDWFNITWPGYAAVITAMAPGRFAAAINQAPMIRRTGLKPLDWILARRRVGRSRALPPAFLLRQAFETCRTFDAAVDLLCHTPVALPVIYSLAGTTGEECCIIERREDEFRLRQETLVAANHWQQMAPDGHARGQDSPGRARQMTGYQSDFPPRLDWVVPPILNSDTRLAVRMNAATQQLLVRGYEADGPATDIFDLAAMASS